MAGTRYFLTGALGCIGAWVVKALAERGDEPVVFDTGTDRRRLTAIMDEGALSAVQFVRGDVTDGAAIAAAVSRQSGARRIIHLAGLQVPDLPRQSSARRARQRRSARSMCSRPPAPPASRHVVYASSAAVFGLADEAVDETVTPEPLTHYGVFKQANEGNARVYYRDHGVSSVGLRPFTVYGVGRDAGITSDPTRAMKSALVGRPFHIRFSGPTDFIHVADTAAAFIACADHAPDGAHVFNIHGATIEVADIVRAIDAQLPASRRAG